MYDTHQHDRREDRCGQTKPDSADEENSCRNPVVPYQRRLDGFGHPLWHWMVQRVASEPQGVVFIDNGPCPPGSTEINQGLDDLRICETL